MYDLNNKYMRGQYLVITVLHWQRMSESNILFIDNIGVTNDHRYFPLVVNTFRSFPHSWLISGFVARLTRVPLVEQELLELLEHLSFSGVRVTQFFVLCAVYCISLFVLLSFFFWPLCCLSFDLRILITPLVFSNSSWFFVKMDMWVCHKMFTLIYLPI